MNKGLFLASVLAGPLMCAAFTASAQDFPDHNCECVDGVLYCSPSEPSYHYAVDDEYNTPTEQTYQSASAPEFETADLTPHDTYEPSYEPPRSNRFALSDVLRDDWSPEFVLLVLTLLAGAIAAIGWGSSFEEDVVEEDVDATKALTDKLEAAAREADAHIAAFLQKSREGGRDG